MAKYRLKESGVEAFLYDGDMVDSNGNSYVPEWAITALENGELCYRDDGDLYLVNGDYNLDVKISPNNDYIVRRPVIVLDKIGGYILTAINKNVFEYWYDEE